MTQNRTCIPRNIENCPFEVREINCSIPCTTTGKFVIFDIVYYQFANSTKYIITHILNLNVDMSFHLEKVADITTMVSLSVETKDTANDSETIETTDTTKKTDDQRTNPGKGGDGKYIYIRINTLRI